jgi:hypothetical protein
VIFKFCETGETQFNDFAESPQVEQAGPMSFDTHGASAVGIEVEKLTPRIRENSGTVVTGNMPKEEGQGDGYDRGFRETKRGTFLSRRSSKQSKCSKRRSKSCNGTCQNTRPSIKSAKLPMMKHINAWRT